MVLQGTNRTAAIWTRTGGEWADSGETWICRVWPISPMVQIKDDRYALSTHQAIGEATPAISKGNQLVISGVNYFVRLVQDHNRPGVGLFCQEAFLSKEE
jgi:hypothetical protein